jgi:hypothetical protein
VCTPCVLLKLYSILTMGITVGAEAERATQHGAVVRRESRLHPCHSHAGGSTARLASRQRLEMNSASGALLPEVRALLASSCAYSMRHCHGTYWCVRARVHALSCVCGVVRCVRVWCVTACVRACACGVWKWKEVAPPLRPKALGSHTSSEHLLVARARCSTVRVCVPSRAPCVHAAFVRRMCVVWYDVCACVRRGDARHPRTVLQLTASTHVLSSPPVPLPRRWLDGTAG